MQPLGVSAPHSPLHLIVSIKEMFSCSDACPHQITSIHLISLTNFPHKFHSQFHSQETKPNMNTDANQHGNSPKVLIFNYTCLTQLLSRKIPQYREGGNMTYDPKGTGRQKALAQRGRPSIGKLLPPLCCLC